MIEAITNVVFSIIFINKYGIVGVLLATVIALPLKVVWCIYISDKKVLHRSFRRTSLILGSNYLFFFVVVIISKIFIMQITSYRMFCMWGIVLTIVIGGAGSIRNIIANRDLIFVIKKYILKR